MSRFKIPSVCSVCDRPVRTNGGLFVHADSGEYWSLFPSLHHVRLEVPA